MSTIISIMESIKVISVGGSIIAPDNVDVNFIKKFHLIISEYLEKNSNRKLILVTGGGGPARAYQKAYREIMDSPDTDSQDRIGISATRLNGQLLKSVFQKYCQDDVVRNPDELDNFSGRILIAAGWKPGFSTDFISVLLAEKYKADTVINLSNIAKIYTADPKEDPSAVPLDEISWDKLKELVGDKWTPGRNIPFDPSATKKGAELKLTVITAEGRNTQNLKKLLNGLPFEGTVIGPN